MLHFALACRPIVVPKVRPSRAARLSEKQPPIGRADVPLHAGSTTWKQARALQPMQRSASSMSDSPTQHVCTIRGMAVTATFAYIARQFGESSLDRVAAELRGRWGELVDTDLLLSEAPDESAALPVRLIVEVMERVGERYLAAEGGAGVLAERVGAFAAYRAQSLLRRIAINLQSPQALLRRASALWGHHHSCGELSAEQTGPRSVRLELSGLHDAHPLFCRRLTGYYTEALARSAGRRARVTETACVTRGAPACVWEADWSGASLI
jgi:hypothetical protein